MTGCKCEWDATWRKDGCESVTKICVGISPKYTKIYEGISPKLLPFVPMWLP